MSNKKIISIAIIIIILLIGLVAGFLYLYPKSSQKPKETTEQKKEVTPPTEIATNFTKAYFTYNYSDFNGYLKSLEPFLSQRLKNDNNQQFILHNAPFVPEIVKKKNEKNYSRCIKTEITNQYILPGTDSPVVEIKVTIQQLDTTISKEPVTSEKQITLILKKEDSGWKIDSLNL